MKRFYTCPLDQVVQEMDQNNSDKSVSLAFSRLFSDHENQEVVFTDKFFDILKLFCNSVLRITNKITTSQMSDEDSERYVINERGKLKFSTVIFKTNGTDPMLCIISVLFKIYQMG